jgi:hypothetical protein
VLAQLVSSPLFLPPRCRLSSSRHSHAAAPCHTSFLLNQNEIGVSASTSDNDSFRRLSSRAEAEALNLYHHSRPPFPKHSTPTLHYYKKDHLNLSHSPHNSIVSLFCLLSSQRNTSLELHPSSSFYFTVVPRSSSLHTMTLTLINYPTFFRFPNSLSTC